MGTVTFSPLFLTHDLLRTLYSVCKLTAACQGGVAPPGTARQLPEHQAGVRIGTHPQGEFSHDHDPRYMLMLINPISDTFFLYTTRQPSSIVLAILRRPFPLLTLGTGSILSFFPSRLSFVFVFYLDHSPVTSRLGIFLHNLLRLSTQPAHPPQPTANHQDDRLVRLGSSRPQGLQPR